MKIFSPIGSKERFNEMFQRVNKIKLNEDISKENVIENAFNELKNNQLIIKQTNSRIGGNQNTFEIVAADKHGNEIIFRFRLTGTEDEQDGVFSVDGGELINFVFKSREYEMNIIEGMNLLTNFNRKHESEIVDVIGDFVDFNKSVVDDAIYEEAIKLIDKIPYKKGTEDMQTNKAYVDEKLTNSKLRVNASEFDKVVKESFEDDDEDNEDVMIDDEYTTDREEEEDMFALPPDYSNMKDPYGDDESEDDESEDDEPEVDASPEEQALFLQAVDNLIAKNKTSRNPNYFPTRFEIDKEYNRLKTAGQPQAPEKTQGVENKMAKGKKRVYPAWADRFLSEMQTDVNADKAIGGYYNQLTPEKKKELIKMADELLEAKIGVKKYQMPKEEYFKMVRELAMRIFHFEMRTMNETEDLEYKEDNGKSIESRDKIAQLARDKEKIGEILWGGKGDGKSPLEFEPDQILMGLEVEKEHTDNPMIAIEIVLDHLSEDPKYYTRKKDPESSAQFGASNDVPSDADMTNVLLGYKPKNVGDGINEIVGAKGATSAVGGEDTDDELKKYQEYEKKDFNSLTDSEKKEYFEIWNRYKQK